MVALAEPQSRPSPEASTGLQITLNTFERGEGGGVLLVALMLSIILGTLLAGYVGWVRTQNVLVEESQAWNAALAHAEGGIEEGMAQINVTFGTNYFVSAQTNWGGGLASGYYGPRSFSFGDRGSYSAIIIPASPGPTIIATGYAMVPIVGRRIARTVEVRTTAQAAFGYGISVVKNAKGSGNNVTIDSYDSNDIRHCTPEGLWDPNTRKAGGDVVSTDGIINVGSANIYGHIATAPWGSVSIQQMNGRVGDLPANLTGSTWNQTGIQPGWYANDMNLDFPDVGVPFSGGITSLPPGTGTNTYDLTTGDYLITTNLTLKNGDTLYVSGNARLWVQGNLTAQSGSPGSCITIAKGASLALYVGTISGPPVSTVLYNVNSGGKAVDFAYYGLPSNVSMTWNGNARFVGTVYAPEADLSLNGSGTTRNDFMGSVVGRSATLNGNFNLHYDEALKNKGPQMGYTVCRWREI